MTVRLVDLSPQAPKPRETLFEFLRGHDRIRCELVDHDKAYGTEAQFLMNEELAFSRMFAPYLSGSRASREMAISWAEAERKAIEARM